MILPGDRPGDRQAIAGVTALVAAALGFRPAELVCRHDRGNLGIIRARQVAMYLAVVDLQFRPGPVGRYFHRDRTTVTHNIAVVEDCRDDPRFDAWLSDLEGVALSFRPPKSHERVGPTSPCGAALKPSPAAYGSVVEITDERWCSKPPRPP